MWIRQGNRLTIGWSEIFGRGTTYIPTRYYPRLLSYVHLVPRSRMHEAIPPLPQYAFMAWCLDKYRDNFAFTSSHMVIREPRALHLVVKRPKCESDCSLCTAKSAESYLCTPS